MTPNSEISTVSDTHIIWTRMSFVYVSVSLCVCVFWLYLSYIGNFTKTYSGMIIFFELILSNNEEK